MVSAVEASSAAKLSAFSSEGAVIPGAALSHWAAETYSFNNLVKKEAIAFVLKLHSKLPIYQIYIFIKSSGLAISDRGRTLPLLILGESLVCIRFGFNMML